MGKNVRSNALYCYDEQAELSILAAITIHPERLYEVPFLKPEHFYLEKHRRYFERLLEKAQEGQVGLEVMAPTIVELGMSINDLTDCYLGDEANTVALAENVVGLWKARKTQEIGLRLVNIMQEIRDPREITNEVQVASQTLSELAEEDMREGKGTTMDVIMDNFTEYMMELNERDGELLGVGTGFSKLDLMTHGLRPGQLIVIAGRPSMGKTAFALNIAQHAAVYQKKRVGIFSLETPIFDVAMRMISSLEEINMNALQRGRIFEGPVANRFHRGWQRLKEAKIFVEDMESMGRFTPSRIKARCRKAMKEWGGLDLIVIDHLQLMQPDKEEDRRDLEIGSITRYLKLMAVELGIPVILLSQLSRGVEQRQEKRPMLSDLRESGAIEQDADIVLFPFRPRYYENKVEIDGPENAEIIIAKHRNGAVGAINVLFFGKYTKFTDGESRY
jgi:replicative DNA helicase